MEWIAAGLAAMAAPAAAPPPSEYKCHAVAGEYSISSHPIAGGAFAVRGTITPRFLRSHRKWLSTASVIVQGKPGRDAVGVQLIDEGGRNRGRDAVRSVALFLSWYKDGKAGRKYVSSLSREDPVPFAIAIDGNGMARLQIGTGVREMQIDAGGLSEVAMSCSTGTFEFDRMEWTGVSPGAAETDGRRSDAEPVEVIR
ncbi:MAG TPA: hypothetical protein VF589_07840 [Allosphingosinicella sp.]